MKNVLFIASLFCFIMSFSTTPFSYLMAEGIVDEDVHAMIDSLVADTPHARLTIEDAPGMKMTRITTRTPRFLEDMIDRGLMRYFPMLDGDVTVEIEYEADKQTTVMSIIQVFENG